MRTEPAQGPDGPGNDRKPNVPTTRPARSGESGPIGFGSVMRDVRGAKGRGRHEGRGQEQQAGARRRHGAKDGSKDGAGADGTGTGRRGESGTEAPSAATSSGGMDPGQVAGLAIGAPLDAGTRAALDMGAVRSTEQLVAEASGGVQDATEALAAQDGSIAHVGGREPVVPTQLGRMSPAALISAVVDEATKHAIDEASRELHVELEPAHLGPLVVRLRRERDGRLDVQFVARDADATRVLDAGLDLLRERLAEAGYAGATVAVERDAALVLGPRA